MLTLWSFRRIRVLPRVRSLPEDVLPPLSVLIAARNEAGCLPRTLQALLKQDYPAERLQIIVVNDRSEDATGELLAGFEGIQAVHIDTLPEGWLGKCHALHQASRLAQGELLLLMDADVELRPDALRQAASAMQKRRLDHLIASPRLILNSLWEQLFLVYFHVAFGFRYLPGHADSDRKDIYIGMGAFNLVRASAYARIGGHVALRQAVLDDMELGRRIKGAGLRQQVFAALDRVQVRWFEGWRGLFSGLGKNAFAACDYRVGIALGAVSLTLSVCLAPLWLMARLEPGAWLAWSAVTAFAWRNRGCVGHAGWACPLWPLGGILVALAIGYSTLVTLTRGVQWRGRSYRLRELRAHLRQNS